MNDYNDQNNGVFVFKGLSCISLGNKGKQVGIYFAGMLFALGWWSFVDGLAILWNLQDRFVSPGIEDWVPGIITTFGMIIVNLIDKEALKGGYSGFDDEFMWRARLFLFLGFAMMAGGLSGSVAVLVTKYIYNENMLDIWNMYLGITDVVQCILIMLSTAMLWLVQSTYHENDFRI